MPTRRNSLPDHERPETQARSRRRTRRLPFGYLIVRGALPIAFHRKKVDLGTASSVSTSARLSRRAPSPGVRVVIVRSSVGRCAALTGPWGAVRAMVVGGTSPAGGRGAGPYSGRCAGRGAKIRPSLV